MTELKSRKDRNETSGNPRPTSGCVLAAVVVAVLVGLLVIVVLGLGALLLFRYSSGRTVVLPPRATTRVVQEGEGIAEPKTALDFFNRGAGHLEKGEHEQAVADFTAAIGLDPKFLKAYMDRGAAHAALGHPELAIADYSSVMRIAPEDDLARWALYLRAQMYEAQDEYDKAIADYTAIIRNDPEDPVNFCNRGDAYAAKKDFENAIADYTEAIRAGPDEATGYNSLAWLRATCSETKFRNGKQAVEQARKACELTSWNEATYLDTLAAAYAEVGNFEEAVKWQKKVQDSPDFPDEERDGARLRLQLYEEGKPFRDE